MKTHSRPVPINAEERKLRVAQDGMPLTHGALRSFWQRVFLAARDHHGDPERRDRAGAALLAEASCITATPRTRADKRDGAGHVNPEVTVRYDHSVPVAAAPKLPRTRRGDTA